MSTCENGCEPVWQDEIQQGETWKFSVDLTDSADVAINITGSTVTFVLKRNFDGASEVTLAIGSGITVTGATGHIEGVMAAATTASLRGSYVGSLKIILSGGEVEVVPGLFTVCRSA